MRFDVYKRALLLTAATVALLSGPSYAANTTEPITTQVTTKLTTSGTNIDVTTATDSSGNTTSTGSIQIPSSSTTSTAPAVEINSSNTVTLAPTTQLTFTGTSDAIGIQEDSGYAGEVINGGTINLTGDGTGKVGIAIGSPESITTGTFTGIADSTDNPQSTSLPFSPDNPTGLTAIALQAASVLELQGDGSNGIQLTTGDTVKGDIVNAGAITVEASSLTSTTTTAPVTGIDLQAFSVMNGNLSIQTGGSVVATGAGARGVIADGQLNGSITNFGEISAVGTSTPSTTTANPEAGSALVIGGSVTGGIYNGGPGNNDTTTASATIETSGTAAALDIATGFNDGSVTTAPSTAITIGSYADPIKIFGNVSLLNRGAISAAPTSVDNGATAIAIGGSSATEGVTLTNGIVNAGSIGAGVTTDTNSVATTSLATALEIGNFVHVGTNTGTQPGFGPNFALVNSNETSEGAAGSSSCGSKGTICASVSGDGVGTAVAIEIGQSLTTSSTNGGTVLTSLFNSGTISATATTTDNTIASLAAYGIVDTTGTLTTITNSGTISAASTQLENYANVEEAINLADAGKSVTLVNTGTIIGDVYLGQHADTVTVNGPSATQLASITGNIFLGGSIDPNNTNDTLTVGPDSIVTGNIIESAGGQVAVSVAATGVLDVTNNGTTINNLPLADFNGAQPNFLVSTLSVADGGTLDLTLAQAFNEQSHSTIIPVVQASDSISLATTSDLNLNFGSYVSPTSLNDKTPSTFVIFDAPTGMLTIDNPSKITADIENDIPFLFNGNICAVGVTGFAACSSTPVGASGSNLQLSLTPKAGGLNAKGQADGDHVGLTGYAATLFSNVNQAIANDPSLGAAVIAAGSKLSANDYTDGQKLYQGIYSSFAPDVTGASRALAISLTDEATGPVGARQRALRMYAGQDSDLTIWGQEFAQRLNIGNSGETTGYDNNGFGFSLGADSGDPHDGRFGGAFTFYSGNTTEKTPRTSKTQSEWFLGTAYSDWRGKGLFVDSQATVGYGQLTGKRLLIINDTTEADAEGKRGSEMLAGGITAGTIFHTGGTVFIPQLSLDGLTLREEGYTENNSVTETTAATDGFDLHVKPYYANSLRAFAGADLRQDLNFGDFFLQPEARAGYRYDFVDGAEKLKAEFACSTVAAGGCGDTAFTLTGPDPAKGNLVAGGGVAVTTGAWSIGVNYDYLRGIGGTKGVDQAATLTLLGRI